MCGIAGVLSAEPVDAARVERMRDALAHRGPDHAGLWRSADGQVCLGHRRLAILDLTPDANQPFLSADGRFAITFNGEIYNFAAIREELVKLGLRFRTRSDTEVLVEAYRVWGAGALPRLSGMFAFAIWDAEERTLFCARDRVGEKPFHYSLTGNAFLFASELKALCEWPTFRRAVRGDAVADFLTFGFIPDPKCIWTDAAKLPPGHWMHVRLPRDSRPIVGDPVAWWDLEFAPEPDVEDWDDAVREAILGAAREMTVSDVPVGAFLSGGVDSSAVTAALALGGAPPTTFTIGFAEVTHDERKWARMVAQQYGTVHRERVVDAGDVAPVMRMLQHQFDEPFNDYSYLPTYYLCREARREITVALSGDGGDELFAGYRKYQRLGTRSALGWLLDAPMVPQLAAAGGSLLRAGHPMRRTIAQYTASDSDSLADMLVTGFDERALATHARGALHDTLAHYSPLDVVRQHLTRADMSASTPIDQMRYLDVKLTLGAGILVKVDRASMAVALEVRPVLLHRDLLALAARIPARALANRHGAKRALKRAAEPWLPRELVHRPKQGFALPLDKWLARDPSTIAATPATPMMRSLVDDALAHSLAAGQRRGESHAARTHALRFLDGWITEWNPGDIA